MALLKRIEKLGATQTRKPETFLHAASQEVTKGVLARKRAERQENIAQQEAEERKQQAELANMAEQIAQMTDEEKLALENVMFVEQLPGEYDLILDRGIEAEISTQKEERIELEARKKKTELAKAKGLIVGTETARRVEESTKERQEKIDLNENMMANQVFASNVVRAAETLAIKAVSMAKKETDIIYDPDPTKGLKGDRLERAKYVRGRIENEQLGHYFAGIEDDPNLDQKEQILKDNAEATLEDSKLPVPMTAEEKRDALRQGFIERVNEVKKYLDTPEGKKNPDKILYKKLSAGELAAEGNLNPGIEDIQKVRGLLLNARNAMTYGGPEKIHSSAGTDVTETKIRKLSPEDQETYDKLVALGAILDRYESSLAGEEINKRAVGRGEQGSETKIEMRTRKGEAPKETTKKEQILAQLAYGMNREKALFRAQVQAEKELADSRKRLLDLSAKVE